MAFFHLSSTCILEVILAASSCRTSITDAVQNASSNNVAAILPDVCVINATKMVIGGNAHATGVITVHGNLTSLGGDTTAALSSISLTPEPAPGTALVGAADGQKQISSWKCGPATATPLPRKYLPGSCQD